MREQTTSPPRGRARRGHRVLSGLLALVLVSMLAAGAILDRPAGVSAQADTLATAALAPDSALVYISASLDQNSAQVTASKALLKRAGLSNLTQSAEQSVTSDQGTAAAQTQADIQPFLGGELGIVVTNLTTLNEAAGAASSASSGLTGGLTGSLTAGLVGTPSATTTPSLSGVVLIDKPTDVNAAWTKAQDLLAKEASNSGSQVTETDYNGIAIKSQPGNPSQPGGGTAIAKVNDFIILSGTPDDLHSVIDTSAGKTGSLDKLDAFGKVQKELRTDVLAFGFVNGPKYAAASGSAMTSSSMAMMSGLGSAQLDQYTGFVVWADTAGFRIDTISVPAGNAAAGTPAAAPATQATLAGKVPGNTMIFADGQNLGKTSALNQLALALAEAITGTTSSTPEAGQSSAAFAKAAQMLGFNLQTDFVQQMVGEYGLALSVTGLDPNGISFVLVSGVKDQAKLNDTLSKLSLLISAGGGGAVTASTKEVNGSQITVIKAEASGLPIQIEYGVVNGQFILGYGDSLEKFVAGYTDTLANNAQFKAVMATLPTDHSSVFYLDIKSIVGAYQGLAGTLGGAAASGKDASPECAKYPNQAAAQAAYDKDPAANFALDQNFNGKACEDYPFPGSAAAAEAASPGAQVSAETALQAVTAFATVGYEKDGMSGSSSILYIPEK